jgi:hypothetical protein
MVRPLEWTPTFLSKEEVAVYTDLEVLAKAEDIAR